MPRRRARFHHFLKVWAARSISAGGGEATAGRSFSEPGDRR